MDMYGYVYVHGMDLYWNRPVAPPTWLRNAPNIYCQLSSVLITKLNYARLRMRQFDFLLANEKNFLFRFDVDFHFHLVFNPYLIRIQPIATLYFDFDFFSFFSSTPQVIGLKEYVRHVACSIFVPVRGTRMIGMDLTFCTSCTGPLYFRPVSSR